MSLHNKIMNIPCDPEQGGVDDNQYAYRIGHRDARHAAAELAAMNASELSQIAVTKNSSGQIVAVTRQDMEGRIISVIAESAELASEAESPSDAVRLAKSRIAELEKALRELHEAEQANYPPATEGGPAQTAWSVRIAKAHDVAAAVLGDEGDKT